MALGLFIMQSFTKGGQESQATRLTKSDAGLSHAPSTSSMTPPSSLSIHPNRPSSHLFPPQAGHHRCLRRRRRHPSRRTARWGRRPTRARRRSRSPDGRRRRRRRRRRRSRVRRLVRAHCVRIQIWGTREVLVRTASSRRIVVPSSLCSRLIASSRHRAASSRRRAASSRCRAVVVAPRRHVTAPRRRVIALLRRVVAPHHLVTAPRRRVVASSRFAVVAMHRRGIVAANLTINTEGTRTVGD